MARTSKSTQSNVKQMSEAIAEFEKENPMSTQTEKAPRKPRAKSTTPKAGEVTTQKIARVDANAVANADNAPIAMTGSKVDLSGMADIPGYVSVGPVVKGGGGKKHAQYLADAQKLADEHLPAIRTLLASGRSNDIVLWNHIATLKQGKANKIAEDEHGKYPPFSDWLRVAVGMSIEDYRAISPCLDVVQYTELVKAYKGEDGNAISRRAAADIAKMWPDVEHRAATKNAPERTAVDNLPAREFAIRVAQTLGRYAWDAFLVGAKIDPNKQGSKGMDFPELESWYMKKHVALEDCKTKEHADMLKDEFRTEALRELMTEDDPHGPELEKLGKLATSIAASIAGFTAKLTEVQEQIAYLEQDRRDRLAAKLAEEMNAKESKARKRQSRAPKSA